jgi:hypothetical protein
VGRTGGEAVDSQGYSVEMPEVAWLPLGGVATQALLGLVRAELARIATELPPCPRRPAASLVSRQLPGDYVALVAIDHGRCAVTLVEVVRRAG